jgi:UDP-N-acetylmuramoylalanine--D-glutamate ligase
VSDVSIQKSLDNFYGVAGRLEKIKTINGADYINDTCATTPDAAIAGLAALAPTLINNSQIILITGGRSKELDMTNYIEKIIELKQKNIIKKILLLSDSTTTGTDILIQSFNNRMFTDYDIVLNLKHGVDAARSAANEGDIILFTPAFASFGMFQNEYDRGEKFNQAVNDLR